MIAITLSLLAAIGLGGGAVSARGAMPPVHPATTIAVSLVVGFIGVVVAAAAFAWSDFTEIPPAAWSWILLLAAVQFVGGRSMGYIGVSIIGPSRTALFICAQAPFAAFLAVAFTGETMHPLIALGTVGVVAALLLSSGDSLTQGWRTDRRYLAGCVIALGAGLSLGAGSVISKQTLAVYDSPLALAALGMLAAMIVLLPLVGYAAARNPELRAWDRKSLAMVAVSGLSTAMALMAQFFAVQRADVVIVAPILATFPLWTLLLSHLFIARLERITLRLTIGALLAVAGVVAVTVGGRI